MPESNLQDRLEMPLSDVIEKDWQLQKGRGRGGGGKGKAKGKGGRGRGRGVKGVIRTIGPARTGRKGKGVGKGKGNAKGKGKGKGKSKGGEMVRGKGNAGRNLPQRQGQRPQVMQRRPPNRPSPPQDAPQWSKGRPAYGGKSRGRGKGANRLGRGRVPLRPRLLQRVNRMGGIQKRRGAMLGRPQSLANIGPRGGKGKGYSKGSGKGYKGSGFSKGGKGGGKPALAALGGPSPPQGGKGWGRAPPSGGGYGSSSNGYSGWRGNERQQSAMEQMSQEDLKMMKKITIVAQLDKVPKPLPAMQGMVVGKGKRNGPSGDSGTLSRRFAANFRN